MILLDFNLDQLQICCGFTTTYFNLRRNLETAKWINLCEKFSWIITITIEISKRTVISILFWASKQQKNTQFT